MVRCIDCCGLDVGFSENDSFPHCSVKHAMDIARLISRRQPEITREEAYEERECEYFQRCDEEADKEFIFELTPEEIEAAREIAIQFQKELEKEADGQKETAGVPCPQVTASGD